MTETTGVARAVSATDLLHPEAASVLEEFINKHYASGVNRHHLAKDVATRCVRMWAQSELADGVFAFLRGPKEADSDD